jgi:rhodanese-related sulfurtransferase
LLNEDGTVLVDLALSPEYRAGHIPGAWFAIRSRFSAALEGLPRFRRLVLTSPDGALARFAAAEVETLTGAAPLLLDGGTAAWKGAGLPLESGVTDPASDPDDVYKRPYEGTDNSLVAMQGYIDWELELVAQLERDGTHRFRVI